MSSSHVPPDPATEPESDEVLPSGVIPPILTPLTPERELDVSSLERLCTFLLDAGVAGLFVAGSTGEAAYLTDQLRARVLQVVVSFTARQVPVLAGVIDMTTPRVVDRARAAVRHGANALVATAPFYAPTHPAEIELHFRTLRAAVDVPIVAYDIPSAVHTKLPAELVTALAQEGVLAGVKDSSGDLDGFRDVARPAGAPSFKAYTGSEVHADLALLLGAAGLVPGLGNVDPAGFVRLYQAARRGDWTAAMAEQERLRRLSRIITVGDQRRIGRYSSAIGAFKSALVQRGILAHATTSLPMLPLNDVEVDAVTTHLRDAGLL
ncbi:dihydrodipicolinate synthase family protein [Thermasporomyces composti]|uniref:4-hydroxy-tetrahydrodipicolinate synthase n=1 Tax=Thermasporomyces composti TaxID=696763 RepID=A0A3D9VFH1_THECX|nr:dihydrodipicolinate synthase family protein [Thermasporomyces composti]REF37895.1 4-hydroxy-tetrahydrodipicolinate synthase [Thermasporomyces composti]